MFEWLQDELRVIPPNTIHSVDGPASSSLAKAVQQHGHRFPCSYIEFVLKFGNASFFRHGIYYLITVLAAPSIVDRGLELLYQFGTDDDADVHFRDVGDDGPLDPTIYGFGDDEELEVVAADFSIWLKDRYDAIRQRYTQDQWQSIIEGPKAFSSEELDIIAARKQFRWSHGGSATNRLTRIRISNQSNRILPYYTLGVHSRDGAVQGVLWLPIRDLQPGSEKIMEVDAYSDQIAPDDVVLVDMPEPTPANRDSYWEFKP